jgi:alkylation response protein AidB-like acyl-CoA dehydrogenase
MSSQLAFESEFAELLDVAHKNGAADEAALRAELADSYIGLQVMKYNGMRMLTNLVHTGVLGPEASIGKLFWTTWHKAFGETAMRVLGADAMRVEAAGPGVYEVDELERIFLSSRAETIYAGASEIQRNIIGERVLGLPREPR